MSLKTYLFRCKRSNAKLLFWLLLNAFCVWANGLLAANALTSLVALDTKSFLTFTGLNLLVYLLWILQIKQVYPAREQAIQDMNSEIRADILQKFSQASPAGFHQQTADTYTSWLTNDLTTINDLGFEVLELMLSQGLNVILSAITLISYHPSFALSVLIFTLVMSALPKLFDTKLADKALLFSQKNEELLARINHWLKGFDILSGAGRLSDLTERVQEAETAYAGNRISYQRTLGSMMASQNGASFMSQLTILTQAGLLYAMKLVPIGTVSSSPYFASVTFASLTGFFANWAELRSVRPIFEKFEQVPIRENQDDSSPLTSADQLVLEQVTLQVAPDITLTYPDLAFHSGQNYLITGPSGLGKSSLLQVLSGHLSPNQGRFLVDDQALSANADVMLQQLVSLVPQESFIFQASLRYNLTLGQPFSDQVLTDKLGQLGLADYLNQLPNGLDSLIDQDSLSGGQAQRLCLLRAVLQDKPILLLDEVTSALDTVSRDQVMTYLDSLKNKTIIMVSHQHKQILDDGWKIIEL